MGRETKGNDDEPSRHKTHRIRIQKNKTLFRKNAIAKTVK